MWSFFQDQVLGMKWLNQLIGNLLISAGLDLQSQWGASLQFFLYDVIKITILLCLLIFLDPSHPYFCPLSGHHAFHCNYHGAKNKKYYRDHQ